MKREFVRQRYGLLAGVILIFVVMGGCATLRDAVNLRRPGARIAGVGLKDVGLESLTLLFDVEVDNPYVVPLPIADLDYQLSSVGNPFLSGKADVSGTVPAKGRKTFSLPVEVAYAGLLQVLKGIRPGEVIPYDADLGLSVSPPGTGPLRLAIQRKGEFPVPTVPDAAIDEVKWDKTALDEVAGHIRLKLVNRNRFPVKLKNLKYGLSLGETEVAKSSVDKSLALAADSGEGFVEIPISFSPEKVGLSVLRMLGAGGADYRLNGDLNIDTPFGPMSLPLRVGG
jgi:LEA14-like dessication related protein